jgi:serine protease Do
MKKLFSKKVVVLAVITALVVLLSACTPTAIKLYKYAVENGFNGTFDEWLKDIEKTVEPESNASKLEALYEQAVKNGFDGDIEQWLETYYSNVTNSAEFAVNKALRSVVAIRAVFNYMFMSGEYASAGSGVIIHEDDKYAYIVTNYHVLYDGNSFTKISKDINVYLYGMYYNDFAFKAEYVGGSVTNDIAVVRILKNDIYKNNAVAAASIGNSLNIRPGQTVVAVGNPNGEGISATEGIVSMESEYIDIDSPDGNGTVELRVIRVDAPVNPGNSGGGLFNIYGDLVGIVNAKYIDEETDNIGYAIPINIAYRIALRLIQGETNLQKVMFGIRVKVGNVQTTYDAVTGKMNMKQTIVVESVDSGAIAEGYLQAGDTLLSFTYNGKTIPIERLYTIGDYAFEFKKGYSIDFTVIRDGETITVTIPISKTVSVR